jgi:uncharacterized protein DUF3631
MHQSCHLRCGGAGVSAALNSVLSRLEGVCRSGSAWKALCPAHLDKNPSLSVSEKKGKILLNCLAGCPIERVLEAAGLEWKDLFTEFATQPRVATEYSYTDEHGTLLYQNVRFDPKDFRLRKPNGKGGWTWKLGNVRRTLYRLPGVLTASDVLIVEGEKDADIGTTLGLTATTSGAAGTWKAEFSEPLCGKQVTVIADADGPGRKHAQQVARSLFGKVQSLKLLELPGAKDLSEWIERGGTREALLEVIQSAPKFKLQSVAGGTVLDQIYAFIRRFVSLSKSQARVAALWIVHTHFFSAAEATPYLAITSAEKESGKTRLLEVFEILVANPWFTGKVTAAVLIRKIDAHQPTLLLDESDAAFGSNKEYAEALRGVLNTGQRKGGKASFCVGQGANTTFRDFSTFCPKAIAGIGKLPDTVAGRAIPIRLKRAAPGDDVSRFRRREVETEAESLRVQIEVWTASIADAMISARPELPLALTDRQQDGAEPLLAIADAAGAEWPQMARLALVELCSEAQSFDDSVGRLLLADIRQVFESRGADRLSSVDLATELADIETSPWGEWSHGKPLTAPRLARLLKPFEVFPECIRVGGTTPRGYLVEQFGDAFRRYLRAEAFSPSYPSPQSSTPQQGSADAASAHFQTATQDTNVADQNAQKPPSNGTCCGVALSDPPAGADTDGIEEDL